MNAIQIRHGDVLLVQIEQLPEQASVCAPDLRGIVLAEGEATGHAHTMNAATATLYADQELNMRWVIVDKPTPLAHQEHATIIVPPGVWRVAYQREYTPQAIRRVID